MSNALMTRPENFKKFVNRYTAIDHHDANSHEVGLIYVLSPAKNPADLAALYTISENSEPEMAAEIRQYIAYIEAHPKRKLGSYGQQNLPFITHPAVKEFAKERMQ